MTLENSKAHERMPPRSLESERWLLTACVSVPSAIDDALEIMGAEDLVLDKHQVVFKAIVRLADSGKPIRSWDALRGIEPNRRDQIRRGA